MSRIPMPREKALRIINGYLEHEEHTPLMEALCTLAMEEQPKEEPRALGLEQMQDLAQRLHLAWINNESGHDWAKFSVRFLWAEFQKGAK